MGGVHFHQTTAAGGAAPPRPRQLPGDVRAFVNRTSELEDLNAILTNGSEDPVMVSVCVIAGTAGAGKTSLALRWAHQVKDRFPDGELHVNLRGYDPGRPVQPQEALHHFLCALGVPAAAIPADTEAAAAHYRSLLADRRMLIVLDNAATASQVRPLLPGSSGSLVVVTSRNRLSGLIVRDGAHRLTLGTLPEEEAIALLRAVTSGYRPEDDTSRLAELAHLCARLPLALRIAAERAVCQPHLSLDDLIAQFRDESALWQALSTGDEEDADAVHTVFAWSYRALSTATARLFRLLGLHPGPDVSLQAAAALSGTAVGETGHLLDRLVGAHLLEQTAPSRYEFHDLLRAYATDQAQRETPSEERSDALRRLLSWYLHSAAAAQARINPTLPRLPLDPPPEGVTPLSFGDYDQAVDWSEQEHPNLLAATRLGGKCGLDRLTWQLAVVHWDTWTRSGPISPWVDAAHSGVAAARRAGDRAGEAELLERLGRALAQSHRYEESLLHHQQALTARHELGDPLGEATSLNAMGLAYLRARRLDEATARFEEALRLFWEQGHAYWAATALSNLASAHYGAGRVREAEAAVGEVLRALEALGSEQLQGNALRLLSAVQRERGEHVAALRTAERAMEIALRLRNRVLEGYWLITLGDAQRADGRLDEALESCQRAASLHRRLGDRSREALAWQGAGETYQRLGRPEEAAAFLRQAAAAFRELGDPWNQALALAALGTPADQAEALALLARYDDPRARQLRRRLAGERPSPPGEGRA